MEIFEYQRLSLLEEKFEESSIQPKSMGQIDSLLGEEFDLGTINLKSLSMVNFLTFPESQKQVIQGLNTIYEKENESLEERNAIAKSLLIEKNQEKQKNYDVNRKEMEKWTLRDPEEDDYHVNLKTPGNFVFTYNTVDQTYSLHYNKDKNNDNLVACKVKIDDKGFHIVDDDEIESIMHRRNYSKIDDIINELNDNPEVALNSPEKMRAVLTIQKWEKLENHPSLTGEKYQVIEAEEFKHLKNNFSENYPTEILKMEQDLKSIAEKTAGFNEISINEIVQKLENHETLTENEIGTIVAAKKMRLALMNEEGSKYQLSSFKELEGQEGLKNLYSLSELESDQIDEALMKDCINEHKANKPPKEHKALIEGGGPTGLLGALKLYLAGSNVTLLNNREEKYQLKQMLRLDPKWVAELRLYLGTDFQDLLDRGVARERPSGYVEVSIRQLSDAMKYRLVRLQSLESKDLGKEQTGDLELLYEYEMEKIEDPQNKGEQFTGVAKLKEVKLKESSGVGQTQETSDDREKIKKYDFDLAVFAGGANDKLRDEYLASPRIRSYEREYSVSVFDKKKINEIINPSDSLESFSGFVSSNTLNMNEELILDTPVNLLNALEGRSLTFSYFCIIT